MADSLDLEAWFSRDVTVVARELLGAELLFDGVGGRITETEAYHPADPASHSFSGPTARNASMFEGPARIYVYRSYGIHWCFNLVCAGAAAVLIRAMEPTQGIERMAERRGTSSTRALCSGPGKVGQALGITRQQDGMLLSDPRFSFRRAAEMPPVVIGPRIGISKAVEQPWRFGIAGSAFLSRGFKIAPTG